MLWSYAGSNTAMDQFEIPPVAIALVRDLMFSGRISATCRAMGISVKMLRDPAQLVSQVAQCLIVDLNQDGAIPAAVQWRQSTENPVIGFVSHVDTAAITAARQAGIDRVMPRSQFVTSLPTILQQAAAAATKQQEQNQEPRTK